MLRWLSESEIRAIHSELLAEHGGFGAGVDEGLLGATLARPQHLHTYGNPRPTLFDLAAAYGFGFARNHCFVDGNKRVALMAIYVFLGLNGYEFNASEVEAINVMLEVASSALDQQQLANWIRTNVVPL